MFLYCLSQMSESQVESGLIGILKRVDPDMIGAMGIVGTVLTFVFGVVLVTSISRAIQSITLARMQRSLIQDMLAKGYSCEEINLLVNGKQKGVLSRLFDSRSQEYVNARPVPPIKNQRPVS